MLAKMQKQMTSVLAERGMISFATEYEIHAILARQCDLRTIPMSLFDQPVVVFAVLFLVLGAMGEIGVRWRLRLSDHIDQGRHEQISATRDEVALLLSLLLGFTLAMALQHIDHRRELVVDEADAIETTSLRAQTLPEPFRGKVLELLREYVDARLAYSSAGKGSEELDETLARTKKLQDRIWEQSLAVAQQKDSPINSIFLQSINETFSWSEKRVAALENRVPVPIWIMLVLISMATCLLVGLDMKRRFWVTTLVWPLMICIVLTLIADLDSPYSGVIQVSQQSMRRLQQDLNTGSDHK